MKNTINNVVNSYFSAGLAQQDPLIGDILLREKKRQASQIELIASENIVSRAVLEALGDTITNKTVLRITQGDGDVA